MNDGRERRDEGMARAERGQDAWKAQAWLLLAEWARSGREFSAQDITAYVGLPPRRNVVGALFSKAKRAGIIIETGYRQSSRPSRHASRQLTWRGAPGSAGDRAERPSGVGTAIPSAPPSAVQFGDVHAIRYVARVRR